MIFIKFKRVFCRSNKTTFLWVLSMNIMMMILLKLLQMILRPDNVYYYHTQYLIKTPGCKIPDLPVFSKDLERYFEYSFDGPHCNEDMPPLVQSNLTSLFLIEKSFTKYKITDRNSLHCCYEELKRKISGEEDQYEYGDKCINFKKSAYVKMEFVHVKCNYDDKQIYEDFFAFVPPKHKNTSSHESRKKTNVLIIGLDSISRLNFHRQMPKSAKFLKESDFVEFLGYNKIADNTHPNLIAMLTGENAKTIMTTCRSSTKHFDRCRFIWDHFKDENYTTSFGEDYARSGIFSYKNNGFEKQPTDYMWGFFNLISEMLLGNAFDINLYQCVGAREVYKVLLQYINDFVLQLESWKVPFFAFFWCSSLSHDELNKPRFGDEIYLNLLQNMYSKGYFENTVVILMSDHGLRFGPYRQTYQGRMEDRLPFLFIRVPKEFEEKYPLATSNLKWNAKMLTTHFDLYETLLDLSSPSNLMNEFIEKGKRISKSKNGFSLFHKIQPTRTCEHAGIPDHWCTCLNPSPVSITKEVLSLFNFTVNYINEELETYSKCEILVLKKIIDANQLSHSEKSIKSRGVIKDFLINFQTEPGDGLFEATVRQTNGTEMEIVDTISRLNLYGNQSYCIDDLHLKLYCYCSDLL